MKFTFRGDPLQKAFWGMLPREVERLCIHLRALPPLQCLQRHIAFRGEFHRSGLPLPEVPQRQVGMFREIHLSGPDLFRESCQLGKYNDNSRRSNLNTPSEATRTDRLQQGL